MRSDRPSPLCGGAAYSFVTPSPLAEAADLLAEGKVVGVPTDTVYGLAAHRWAQQELFRLKGRAAHKPIPVLVGSTAHAERLAVFTPMARRLAQQHWPGPLTLVLAAGDGTIGIRLPDHPPTVELLSVTGPLAVTSANRSGEPPTLSAHRARLIFGKEVPCYLPGKCRGGVSSTVIESLPGRAPRVLREGPVNLCDQT